jgi:hypothetical protein
MILYAAGCCDLCCHITYQYMSRALSSALSICMRPDEAGLVKPHGAQWPSGAAIIHKRPGLS